MIIIDTLLKVLRAIKRARFVEYIIAILAAILSVVVLLQVVFRYALNNPLHWTEEMLSLIHIYSLPCCRLLHGAPIRRSLINE